MTFRTGRTDSSSPTGMFAFDETFGQSKHADHGELYNTTPVSQPSDSHDSKPQSTLPWLCNSKNTCLCPAAIQILDSYYSQLNLPSHPTEQEAFRSRYQRDRSLIERVIKLRNGTLQPSPEGGFSPLPRPDQTGSDNTTVFVGGLQAGIHTDLIRALFTPFGDIDYVKTPPGKGCGFVRYFCKADAEKAIEKMQGFEIEHHRLRLSWGRSTSGEKSGGGMDTRSLQRLVRYVEPQMASRILTAIDEVFEGNMQTFREGLQYLVIANAATAAMTSRDLPPARLGALNASAPSFTSPAHASSEPSSGYNSSRSHPVSTNEFRRSSSESSSELHSLEDSMSFTSFSLSPDSETFNGWQSSTPATIRSQADGYACHTKQSPPALVDLRSVSDLAVMEFNPYASLPSMFWNTFGPIGMPSGASQSSVQPMDKTNDHQSRSTDKPFSKASGSVRSAHEQRLGRQMSDQRDKKGSEWTYPSVPSSSWASTWYSPTSRSPGAVRVGSGSM